MENLLKFLSENWVTSVEISGALLLILLRVIPSEKNRDLLRFVFEILDKVIPNIKKGGGKHTLKMIALFFLISIGSVKAQNNSVFKGAVSINTDSAAFKAYIATQETNYGSLGALYYNELNAKWRIYADSAWHDLNFGGSGDSSLLEVGVTPIISGANTRILYDNNGILGEYTVSGTSSVAMTNGPILINPVVTTQAVTDNTTLAASTAFVRTITPYVTPEMYGALGDGVTNDQAAIQNAVNSGKTVYFGAKTYLINSAVNLPDGASIIGSDNNTLLKTTANISMINIQGQLCSIQGITFFGSGSGAGQVGVAAVGNGGFTLNYIANRVRNCRFLNLGFAGIYSTNILGSSSGSNHEGAFTVSDCVFSGCTTGIYWQTRGEYNNVSNCKIYNGTTGIRIVGGNNSFSNCQITGNTTGVILATGANDGHGVMSGSEINHNTTNISSTGLLNGYLFTGCMVYSGLISVVTSDGVRFQNSEFGLVTTVTSTNSTNLSFSNIRFVTTPTFTITGTAPTFLNNHWIAGIPSGTGGTESLLASGFTFNATGNVITAGSFTGATTATLPPVNLTGATADPSGAIDGSFWYRTDTDEYRGRANGTNFSFGSGGATSPAGSDTQVQFNNAGSFGADTDFTFLTDRATITNATINSDLRATYLTSGRVPYITTSGAFTDEAGFEYNSSTNNLAVGSAFIAGGTDPLGATARYRKSSITGGDIADGTFSFNIAGGESGANDGMDFAMSAGTAYTTSGNGSGGGISFTTGAGRSAGSGRSGDFQLTLATSGIAGSFVMPASIAGGTGAVSINTPTGQVRFAGGATTLVVTNSGVKATDMVFCTVLTNDTTAVIKNVVAGAGSFTITLSAAATAETYVGFFIVDVQGN